MEEPGNFSRRIQRGVNIEIDLARLEHGDNVGHGIRPSRSENPDVSPIGLRNRVIDVEQDRAVRRVDVHARDRSGQIRKLEGKDRGRLVGRESQARDAGSLGIDPAWRTQRSQVERRSISLRRLIEIVHFDQGNTGRIADAAHDSRVIAGRERRDDCRFAIISRRECAGVDLRLLRTAPIIIYHERSAAPVMQLEHWVHEPARDRSAAEIEGRTS